MYLKTILREKNLFMKGKGAETTKFLFYFLKKISQLPPPPLYLSPQEKDTFDDVFVNIGELNCS